MTSGEATHAPVAEQGMTDGKPSVEAASADERGPTDEVPGWAEISSARPRWRSTGLCFLVVFCIYGALIPRFLRYSSPPTGDQPFYLMDAASIADDWDIDVKNNYENADFDKFYSLAPRGTDFIGMSAPYPLPAQLVPNTVRPRSEWYSFHMPGLGLILAPVWKLGGEFGLWWPATILLMCAIGAALVANAYLLAYQTSRKHWVAVLVAAAIAFSGPVMSHSFEIFTELSMGLLLVYAFRRLAMGWQANGRRDVFLVGLCIAFLPWLAWRGVLLSATLGLYAVVQWRRYRKQSTDGTGLWWLVAPNVVSAGLIVGYSWFIYGWIWPIVTVPEAEGQKAFFWPWEGLKGTREFSRHALGLLYDDTFGLLSYTPVYVLTCVGLLSLLLSARSSNRRLAWITVIMLAPYWMLVAGYIYWHGIWCAPARHATTLTGLAAAPLAMSLSTSVNWARRAAYALIFLTLTAFGWLMMGVFMYDPHFLWPGDLASAFKWLAADAQSPWKVDLLPYLPSMVAPSVVKTPRTTALLLAISVLIVVLGDLLVRPRQARSRGLRAWMLYITGLALAAGLWAGANEPSLRHPTLLTEQKSWTLPQQLPTVNGIAYLDGSVYITVYAIAHPETDGTMWKFDLAAARMDPFTVSDSNGVVAWKHPADAKVGPDGTLYLLNNGPGDAALLTVRPDGQVVARRELIGASGTCTGIFFTPDHGLYVSDGMGGSVIEYGPSGGAPKTYLRGDRGILNNPASLFVDRERRVYTIDAPRFVRLGTLGQVLRQFDLECVPLYYASPPGQEYWVDATCGSGIISLDLRNDRIQVARQPKDEVRLNGRASLTYAPDGTLYVLDQLKLTAFSVQH